MPTILCFDLGVTIGFAAGALDGYPTAHAVVLAGTDPGWRFGQAANTVRDLIVRFRPDSVWKEAPVVTTHGTTAHVLKLHYGLHAVCEEVSWRHGVPCTEVDADDVRQALIGRTRLRKVERERKVTMKHLVAEGLVACGYDQLVRNHNTADAVALWLFVRNDGKIRRPR